MIPSAPSVTARTAAVFVTIVKTTSAASATSRGLSAHRMPASSSHCAFSSVRFQPVTVWPASSRRFATPPPITPRPTKPSSAIEPTPGDVRLDAREVRAHLGASARLVAVGDRPANRAVLLDRALGALRDEEDLHERSADHVADRVHAVQDEPVSGRLRDGEV